MEIKWIISRKGYSIRQQSSNILTFSLFLAVFPVVSSRNNSHSQEAVASLIKLAIMEVLSAGTGILCYVINLFLLVGRS